MGLLYLFPTSIQETDYVQIYPPTHPLRLRVKSYGLPRIFWIYALCILLLLAFLVVSIYPPLQKLASMASWFDNLLITGLCLVVLAAVVGVISFLYWRTDIVITQKQIQIQHRPFGINIFQKNLNLAPELQLNIQHFMHSPNMARLHGDERYKLFENKGYFELWAKVQDQQLLLDRANRKQDLIDLQQMLFQFLPKNS